MARKFLDLDGLKHFISKIIGKTDISKIGDGTCTGAINALNQSMNALDNLKGWHPYHRSANFTIKNGQTTITIENKKITDIAIAINAVYTSQPFSAVPSIQNGSVIITLYNGSSKAADGVAWLIIDGLLKLE